MLRSLWASHNRANARKALLYHLLFLFLFFLPSLSLPSFLFSPFSPLTCVVRNARRRVNVGHELCAEFHRLPHDEEVGEGIGPDSPVVDGALCTVSPAIITLIFRFIFIFIFYLFAIFVKNKIKYIM
jgi:hypothetical protein